MCMERFLDKEYRVGHTMIHCSIYDEMFSFYFLLFSILFLFYFITRGRFARAKDGDELDWGV